MPHSRFAIGSLFHRTGTSLRRARSPEQFVMEFLMAQAALPTEIGFLLPPTLRNEAGQVRTVGVEVEFAGPSAETTVHALRQTFGGTIIEEDPHAYTLKGS